MGDIIMTVTTRDSVWDKLKTAIWSIIGIALITWMGFGIKACADNERYTSSFIPSAFKARGIDHPLKLVHLEKAGILSQGKLSGSMIGGLLSFGGSIEGSERSEHNLMYYWVDKDGSIVPTCLPYSKFRFKIDNTITEPTATLVFKSTLLNEYVGGEIPYKTFIDNKQQIVNAFIVDSHNLNTIIYGDQFIEAVISISMADFQRGVYLISVNK